MPCPPPARPPLTVAVMQPYFFPYAGYFRLLAQAEVFVLFDCVQHRARGRVHRTEVPAPAGGLEWLTLPLAGAARETRIQDLRFADQADALWAERLARHAAWARARGEAAEAVRAFLQRPLQGALVDHLEASLRLVAGLLGLPARLVRSSSLAIDPALKGQDRVLAIVQALGGQRYLNPPGGRALYDAEAFAQRGLTLDFLPDYSGPHRCLLTTLLEAPTLDALRADVHALD